MTSAEINEYLHGDEMVPVAFLKDCAGLGFLVNPEKAEADIPATYRANIPFWLAAIMGSPEAGENQFLAIGQPPWLRDLGPGYNPHNDSISYDFAGNVGVACGDDTVSRRLVELYKERIPAMMDAGMQGRKRSLDGMDGQVFLKEEKEMIKSSKRAVQDFFGWKTGETSAAARIRRDMM